MKLERNRTIYIEHEDGAIQRIGTDFTVDPANPNSTYKWGYSNNKLKAILNKLNACLISPIKRFAVKDTAYQEYTQRNARFRN